MSWLATYSLVALDEAQRAAREDTSRLRRFEDEYERLVASNEVRAMVLSKARMIVGKRFDAQVPDVAQNVLKKLLVAPRDYLLAVDDWAGWLSRVARNAVVDEYRVVKRFPEAPDPDPQPPDASGAGSPDADMLERLWSVPVDARHACLHRCLDLLNGLPRKRRRANALAVWVELHGEAPDNATLAAEYNRRHGESLGVNAYEQLVSHTMRGLRACIDECVREAA